MRERRWLVLGTAGFASLVFGVIGIRLHLRPRTGRLTLELSNQPVEARQVVSQPGAGIEIGVIQDADGPPVAAVANRAQQLQVQFTRAEGQNLLAALVTVGAHAVEIQRIQPRLDLLQQSRETFEMRMAVMQVIHEANIVELCLPVVLRKVSSLRISS